MDYATAVTFLCLVVDGTADQALKNGRWVASVGCGVDAGPPGRCAGRHRGGNQFHLRLSSAQICSLTCCTGLQVVGRKDFSPAGLWYSVMVQLVRSALVFASPGGPPAPGSDLPPVFCLWLLKA